jgi:hypothetical protein
VVACAESPRTTKPATGPPELAPACIERVGYLDADLDGFGNAAAPATGCAPRVVENADDCDDSDAGVSARTIHYQDADRDGWGGSVYTVSCGAPEGFVAKPGDCDDSAADVHPEAPERCNGRDEDCDGRIDDDDDSVLDPSVWYRDVDEDGHGDPTITAEACQPPAGFVAEPSDCDDLDPGRAPTAPERCLDGTDDDCDGVVDEGCPQLFDGADAIVRGTSGWDQLGADLRLGDWNGDGVLEAALGAPGSDASGEGTGDVYLLQADALLEGGRVDSLDTVRLWGGPFDVAGFSIGPALDLNQDGVDDLLVSLVGGGTGLPGAVSVVYGPITADAALPEIEALRIRGTNDYDGLAAWDVAVGRGDAGRPTDLLVGVIGDDSQAADAGAAVLWPLPQAGLLKASSAPVRFEGTVERGNLGMAALRADLDGDGRAEVVLGEPGAARVVAWSLDLSADLGSVRSVDAASMQLYDSADTTEFGARAESADVDGDGYADLVVGAPAASDPYRRSGRWDVVHGPFSGTVRVDTQLAARLVDPSGLQTGTGDAGSGVVLADLDADDTCDALIGSPGYWAGEVGAGGVFWFAGPLSGTSSLEDAPRSVLGTVVEEAAGDGLDAGDLDGDGWVDIVVGAPMDDDDYGRVGVFLGSRAAW